MTESKVFKLPENVDATAVGKEVENFLRGGKNLVTEGTKTPDGYFVQAKEQEGSTWKKISGTTLATQVQIIQISDTITVNIGNGEWSDKIGAGVVGAFIFAPLAVTAAIGAYNQKKLPKMANFSVEFLRRLGYNITNLKCSIKLVSFEPTFTFMGFLYCQVAVKPSLPGMPGTEDWKGRQKLGCGYPPGAS